ncbi:hypothetical protein AVEN_109919-1 [Araneus ventricosus]|uniref:Uncharacterized protein n=1 Tax=Araneus ventricosus TaxID=182803 RepID=A0A4Y2GR70_ARAVE|nr:hypothetical protein AVEN_109919-1 [Araneus ventricosus]
MKVETTEEEIDLDVQEPVEVFMDSVESVDVSSIDDQVTVNEHTIKTVEEKTDIQESVGLCNEVDNNSYPIAGPSKNIPSPFKRVLFWLQREDDERKKRKHEKLPAVVISPQMIIYYKKKEDAV